MQLDFELDQYGSEPSIIDDVMLQHWMSITPTLYHYPDTSSKSLVKILTIVR